MLEGGDGPVEYQPPDCRGANGQGRSGFLERSFTALDTLAVSVNRYLVAVA